jgi:YjbE family integral membrane protein
MAFLIASITIAVVNLTLSGDNAILIAIVTRSLPLQLRKRSIGIAAVCDVIVRTAATFFAAQLLGIPLLRFVGGMLIITISLRLFRRAESESQHTRKLASCWNVVWFLVTADLLMSTDNMVAIAGIAQDRILLLFAGYAMSIPLVFCGSQLVSTAMRRYPLILYVGAGILGLLGGKMMITDAFALRILHPNDISQQAIECATAAAVLTAGWVLRLRVRLKEKQATIGMR